MNCNAIIPQLTAISQELLDLEGFKKPDLNLKRKRRKEVRQVYTYISQVKLNLAELTRSEFISQSY